MPTLTLKSLTRAERSDTDSIPTPLGLNHTAALASPSAEECYSQDNNKRVGLSSVVVSPTAPWTNAQEVPVGDYAAGRQMPLLRRTSDKLAPKKDLQSAPKTNDPSECEKRFGIPRKSNEKLRGSDQDQNIKDDDEGCEKLTHSDHDGILEQK